MTAIFNRAAGENPTDRATAIYDQTRAESLPGIKDALTHGYRLGLTLSFEKVLAITDTLFGTPLEDDELPDMVKALIQHGMIIESTRYDLAKRMLVEQSPNMRDGVLRETLVKLEHLGVID